MKKIQLKTNIFQKYLLLGVEKTLRKDNHFKNHIGEEINVKLFKPLNKSKQYQGNLESFNENILRIETNEGITEIERNNVAVVKTVYDWS